MSDHSALTIGEAARVTGLTPKNIRYYEQIGLLPNLARRNSAARTGGNRLFRETDVRRLRFIHHSRLLGLSLNDIAQLVDLLEPGICPGTHRKYEEKLKVHLQSTADRIRQLGALQSELEGLIALSGRGEGSGSCGCLASPQTQKVTFHEARPLPSRRVQRAQSAGNRR